MKAFQKLVYSMIFLLAYLVAGRASAATYYLSAYGNDSHNGRSPATAWRSLGHLQTQLTFIVPGDSILFECGDVFRGTLSLKLSGIPQQWIYIGSYGNGPQPIISGTVSVSNWTKVGYNLWKSHFQKGTNLVTDLFVAGQPQPLGRFPDYGFLSGQKSSISDNLFHDNHLRYENDYWAGAEVVVRSSRWTLDVIPVQSYRDNAFQLVHNPSYSLTSPFSYFIQNHLSTLSRTGEWFFNKVHQDVYLYATWNPNQKPIEVNASPYGFVLANSSYVHIEGITFSGQQKAGLQLTQCDHVQILHNQVQYAGINGMEVKASNAVVLKENRIRDIHNNGIVWQDNTNGLLEGNTIQNIGVEAGRGGSGNGTYIGLYMTGNGSYHNIVRYNIIDSTGYSAIDFRTGSTSIQHNYIRHFCLVKDDGGGIYTWGNKLGHNQIEGNIIIGSAKLTLFAPHERFSNGIYIDDRSAGISIQHNTVAYCDGAGLVAHNAAGLSIKQNLLLGNGNPITKKDKAQLMIDWEHMESGKEVPSATLEIKGNTLVATRETQRCLSLKIPEIFTLQQVLQFHQNQFVAPQEEVISWFGQSNGNFCDAAKPITFPQWQAKWKMDSSSSFQRIPDVSTRYSTMFTMEGEKGWKTWPDGAHHWFDPREEALKVSPTSGASPQVLLYRPGFQLQVGKLYRLSFVVSTKASGKLEFVPLMQGSPWQAMGKYQRFITSPIPMREVLYFTPDFGGMARLNFKNDQEFWIKDILLQEVLSLRNASSVKLIYNPKNEATTYSLDQTYYTLKGQSITGSIMLSPYGSAVLLTAKKTE